MTELQQYERPGNGQVSTWPGSQQKRANANSSVVALGQWAEAAKAAHEVSEVLVRTPFVPDAYKDNPYAATAAILAGGEVGLNPMASLKAFDVIQGQAAAKAMTLRAIVLAAGHEIWVEESTDARAVVRGRRAGSSTVQESTWTIQRAKTMNLTGKQNWKLQPGAMLVARATSECARLVAADAILGIPYSSEELTDQDPDGVEASTEQAVPQRTVQRRTPARTRRITQTPEPVPAPDPSSRGKGPAGEPGGEDTPAAAAPSSPGGPPLPGEDGYDEPPAEEPADPNRPASQAQNRMMHALFREADVTEREDRLHLTGLLLNRQLDTSKGLTVADGKAVIDALENLKASGHDEGLVGAVNDLFNLAEQKRIEAEENDRAAEDAAVADEAAGEQS